MTQFEKIDLFRKRYGMTGADIERRLGLSNAVYSQWKSGKSNPSAKSISALAKLFGVSVEDLEADDKTEISAAFHEAQLTAEEEDELWRRARDFYNYLRQEKLKEKRRQK